MNNKKSKTKGSTIRGSIIKDNIEFFFHALPAIVVTFIFCYMPMYGVIIAFKQFNPNKGIWGSPWVGVKNFDFFFTSQDAVRITRNTLLYNGVFIVLDIVFAVMLALMFFNLKNKISLKIHNTIVILPKFMSAVLVSYIVYAILNPASGILNQIMGSLGFAGNTDWYSKPEAWPFILTFVHIWQNVGMNCILYYASLMSIDDSLFEAAIIEGAKKKHLMFNICVPHLIPVITISFILAVGGIFGGDFGLFYQTTRNIGTLYPTTDIIPTYVFRGLKDGNMSISAAVGLFQSLVGMLLVILTNIIVKKVSPENSLF